ncbi:MAG: hypothetical protein R3228_12835 [Halioglobus sp.]|nr:hypothetical protein [Halioglobus sp.]
MRKLCESPSLVDLRLLANYLELEGVEVQILNEHQGGNPGVPHWALSVWAELWVKNPGHFDRAVALLARYREAQVAEGEPEWRCSACGEVNPGSFEICWHCGEAQC